MLTKPAGSATQPDIAQLQRICTELRIDIVKMIGAAGSGHPGGSLSEVELLVALYYAVMRHDAKNPSWPDRDRFILSKGHGCPALYAVLAHAAVPQHLDRPVVHRINPRSHDR